MAYFRKNMGIRKSEAEHTAIRGVRQELARWRRFGLNLEREVRESGIRTRKELNRNVDRTCLSWKALFEGKEPPPHLVTLEKLALLLDIDRDVMFSWADRIAPDIVSLLAEHPILCKKIRRYGALMLTQRERRLENQLLIGSRRRIPDEYFREKAPLPKRNIKYRK